MTYQSIVFTLTLLISPGLTLFSQPFLQKIDFGDTEHFSELTAESLFVPDGTVDSSTPHWGETLESGLLLNIEERYRSGILNNSPERLKIGMPVDQGEELNLLLKQVDLFQGETLVFSAKNRTESLENFKVLFYWGVVEGAEESMVSLSIFEDEIIGFIYADGVEYTLGKMDGDPRHIIYRNDDLRVYSQASCFFDEEIHAVETGPGQSRSGDSTNCVNVYVEANHDIYLQKGSVAAAAAYVLGAFSQVGILYANENIEFNVSEILVWDEPSPYTGPGAGQYLTQFRNHLNGNYNGDIAHLVGFGGGGGVAYLNVLCNSYWAVAYSGIASSYNDVPVYSWTVMVIAHEIGHNLGSRHTHACVWNGNNTAIDGCGPEAGYSEGCDGPLPAAGTIMSYCHLIPWVGIDFVLGFGPQPGDLMRNNVYNASCLDECDNIENDAGIAGFLAPSAVECENQFVPKVLLYNYGNNTLDSVYVFYSVNQQAEDSIFWTGTLAPLQADTIDLPELILNPGRHFILAYTANPNGTNDPNSSNDSLLHNFTIGSVALQLQIVLDNYPNETTWIIADENEEVLFSGGPYGGYSSGDSVNYSFCLESGCFEYTIYDSYGDGICCAYGEGSYVLFNEDTGEVLASGGEFGFEETTEFCLETPLSVYFESVEDIECGEPASGTAVAVGLGGEGVYSYSWSNGSEDSLATGLQEGFHFVTVSDGVDEVVDSVFIHDPNSYWFADEDGDGFGNPNDSIYACDPPAGYVDNNLDCDDTNPEINPEAEEICDGLDNNCDGTIDFGLPPTAVCEDIAVYLDESGTFFLDPDDLDGGSSDTCGVEFMEVSQTEFDCEDIGQISIVLTVYDQAGRSDSCISEVSVLDSLFPVAVCKDVVIYLDENAENTIDIGDLDDGSSASCGIESMEISSSEFSCMDIGINVVQLTVTATNGLEAHCFSEVEVLDTLPPTTHCTPITIEVNDPDTSYAILASDFDAGSSANCLPLSFSFDGPSVVNCDSAGSFEILLTVEDASGNSAQCSTQLIVICDFVFFTISGKVETESGNAIGGADLIINDSFESVTNSTGNYEINLEGDMSYTIELDLDDMTTTGISTLDLILIQRHILGIEMLNSPYKIIAADVNMDGFVTTFDLVLLQAYILGVVETLPHGISWVFIPEDFVFDDPNNPFEEDWPEVIEIAPLEQNEPDQDWMGLKIGDVTGAASHQGSRLMHGDFLLEFTHAKEEDFQGETSFVVASGQEVDIAGFQLEFSYSEGQVPPIVDFSHSVLHDFSERNIFVDEKNSAIRVNWWVVGTSRLDVGDEFFRILLPKGVELDLELNGRLMQSEIYNTELHSLLPQLIERSSLLESLSFQLFQNRPNPFGDKTVIPWFLPEGDEVILEIRDTNGRVVYKVQKEGQKGLNYHAIELSELPSGLYIYSLKTKYGVQSKTMINQQIGTF